MAASAHQESRSPNLDVLILGGRPIREPVAWMGPFVMNTREEVLQAVADYQAGRLGSIPAVHNTPTTLIQTDPRPPATPADRPAAQPNASTTVASPGPRIRSLGVPAPGRRTPPGNGSAGAFERTCPHARQPGRVERAPMDGDDHPRADHVGQPAAPRGPRCHGAECGPQLPIGRSATSTRPASAARPAKADVSPAK